MISLVVARARNGAIGRDNDIPWHSPEDLRSFQRETLGSAVVMGRRTWDSLPVKPLKNRMNIVVSRDAGLAEHVAASVADAIAMAQAAGYTRINGIGGQAIYREMLPLADRLLVTEVDLDIPDADAFFPAFDEGDWKELTRRTLSGDGPGCVLRELIRR
ncbi:dihydrofolate reductase [Paracoccus shanxieyensis]|uniref:Dihydrofolate reductase n=1 Tax=Paracoccus shanxieyensis TaxID=2675752 RepID=A0A6L6IXY4_9RHOB|nr:dihydrofolate reductase [Paracoccus shanxieyensis]MTH64461.1 dihydrofolate reductase [Paracoccus shanxieyensis]MTH87546.1 dihydrofolate reductase [Paracoccus shanxieyensis]